MVTEQEREQIQERMAKAGINNLGAFLRRVHETGHIYDADLEELHREHERLWDGVGKILSALADLE